MKTNKIMSGKTIWKEVKDELPPLNTNVLLRYEKGASFYFEKGVFLVEGFLTESKYHGLEFYDYARRLIHRIDSKKPKNKVLEWTEIEKIK